MSKHRLKGFSGNGRDEEGSWQRRQRQRRDELQASLARCRQRRKRAVPAGARCCA